MEANEQKTGTSVRWLVVGAFSAAPAGKRLRLTHADLAQAVEAAKIGARVTVTDRLGADATRTFDVVFPSFKAFQTNEVVASVPTLKELSALGAALAQTDAAKRPSPDAA